MKKFFIFILLSAILSEAHSSGFHRKAYAQETGEAKSYSSLKKAKELLDSGRHGEAIENLKAAYQELPAIRDYTLYFMADAYNKTANFTESNRCIDELLKSYRGTPLRKKAMALRIKNMQAGPEDRKDGKGGAVTYLERYVGEYPEDAEAAFTLGMLMKDRGETTKSAKLFKQVYIANNSFSEKAYMELQPSVITSDDMLQKAANFMKAMEYKKAESVLVKALPAADASMQNEMQRLLATSLFRQKKYEEAAHVYSKAGDIYNAARAYYRKGDMDAFSQMISRLISMEDRRAGRLLIAYASHKRREGKAGDALKILADAAKTYPYLTETALWEIAWIHFRSGDCGNSLKTLVELDGKYGGAKYAYWRQRCERKAEAAPASDDKSGSSRSKEKPSPKTYTVQKRRWDKTDYYSLLLFLHDLDKLNGNSVSRAAWAPAPDKASGNDIAPQEIKANIERFNILLSLGMREDAANEMISISHRASKPGLIIYISRRLQEVGEYKKAIAIASSIPADGIDINSILYPLAYWPIVSEATGQHAIDPFLLLSVMREESRFDPSAQSPAGALGLMQIMPQTAYGFDKKLRTNISGGNDILDIRINVTIGSYYLSSLLKKFGSLPVALASYNAGEEKVREWLNSGDYKSPDEFIEDIPYEETKGYVKRILLSYAAYLDMNDRLGNQE